MLPGPHAVLSVRVNLMAVPWAQSGSEGLSMERVRDQTEGVGLEGPML